MVRRQTRKALQVFVETAPGSPSPLVLLWLPRSVVGDADAGQENFTLDVPEWLLEQKMEEIGCELD
jgi:hypothetical protein